MVTFMNSAHNLVSEGKLIWIRLQASFY